MRIVGYLPDIAGSGGQDCVTGTGGAAVAVLAEGAEPMPGLARRPGAGRRKLEEGDLGLRAALRDLWRPPRGATRWWR